ncbi:universal stress protein [Natronobacterium texcoconense]|uniref:Nucleotide-binding universal stress protein, UspA family n=1 Tax=Natronobacterium texcoconense TaxID=1095778 RepID=A0A1H1GRW2_NATTX|nr:universal stress protein [Natronobacterium texcoconense]SDR15925.1 Nucleotide-binding universal stress protein, UspA family [Natronobacterium texcoconense]
MPAPRDHRVLVPVDVLGGEGIPQTVVDAFASVPITLLAYREIPDQIGTDQARDQFGDRARAELEELQAVFEDAGCVDVSTRLVFTHDRLKTFERVALAESCTAVLMLNPAPKLESVLVAVRGDVNLEYIASFLGTLVAGTDLEVTFFRVVSDEDDRDRGYELLETAVDELADTGVDRDRIDTSIVVDGSPTAEIVAAADDHDMLVVGESRPSVRRFIFRDRAKTLARGTVDPVLVIRGEYLEEDEESTEEDGGYSSH